MKGVITALVVTAIAISVPDSAAAQPRISNGQLQQSTLTARLTRAALEKLGSASGPTWVGYAVPAIAEEAVKVHAGNLWCQFTVISEEGARIAEAGGVSVVMDRCIKVEHARYVGRMHWLGFNTQIITSVRGGLQ